MCIWCSWSRFNLVGIYETRSIVIELYPGNSNTDNYIRFSKLAQIRYHRLSTDIVSGTEIEFRDATVKLSISKINESKI